MRLIVESNKTMQVGQDEMANKTYDRRSSLDVLKENNGKKNDDRQKDRRRRTSLPSVLTYQKRKMVMNFVDSSNSTSEIQTILDEITALLRQQETFEDAAKRLNSMLNTYREENNMGRQPFLISLEEGNASDDLLRLRFVQPRGQRNKSRSETQRYKATFSTTTTATGLPTEEPQPDPKIFRHLRPPSTKSPIGHSRFSSPSLYNNRHDRRLTCPDLSLSISSLSSIAKKLSPSIKEMHDDDDSVSEVATPPPRQQLIPQKRDVVATSPQAGAPLFSRSSSVPPERHVAKITSSSGTIRPPTEASETPSRQSIGSVKEHPEVTVSVIDDGEAEEASEETHGGMVDIANLEEEIQSEYKEALPYFNDYQGIMLQGLNNWNFPMFELAYKTDSVMSQMAYKIFRDMGIFDTFKLGQREFVNFMMELERGYRSIPYHNRIHAADVLHGCWFLTTQDITGFSHDRSIFKPSIEGSLAEEEDEKAATDEDGSDKTAPESEAWKENNGKPEPITEGEESSEKPKNDGCLSRVIPALELMALYLAAAMHDYDHPGRTNAFLVATRDPLAVLYNDRSVLENHHSAAAWKLFHSDPKFNFLESLDTAEWKRLRFLVIEAILATDLKKHFDIQQEFTAKAIGRTLSCGSDDGGSPCGGARRASRDSTCIDWSQSEDRLLVTKMVIKLADIGGPAKKRRLHVTWTKAICQEFFEQGDEERSRDIPVSRFMDRDTPEVASLQCDFINHLIEPMIRCMSRAGLLPGQHAAVTDGSEEEEKNLICERVEDQSDAESTVTPPLVCPLLEQLNSNLKFWKEKPAVTGSAAVAQMDDAFSIAYPIVLNRTEAEHVEPTAFSKAVHEEEPPSTTPS